MNVECAAFSSFLKKNPENHVFPHFKKFSYLFPALY